MGIKICLITPTMKQGGMERVISILANYLVSKGIKVYIICLISGEVAYELDSRVQIVAPRKKYRGGIYGKLLTLFFLCQQLRSISPTSSLSFSEIFNPLSVIAAHVTRNKCYISNRSSPYRTNSFVDRVISKATYPFADGLIVQTHVSKQAASEKRLNKNIVAIPNPLKCFDDKGDTEKKNLVVSVGRLVKSKSFDELIDIFEKADDKKEWHLVILGDGPERANLGKKIAEMRLQHRVLLKGAVDDVDRYLYEAKIFAFTSKSEGFPNALSEAIAAPLPVIAYDCIAGPSEMISDGQNGYLIELNNASLFEEKLHLLMQSPCLREQFVSSFRDYRQRLSQKEICDTYLNFILDK